MARLKLKYENPYGSTFKMSREAEGEFPDGELETFGSVFHDFLQAVGFSIYNGDTLMMEPLTYDELEYLESQLVEYRLARKIKEVKDD